MIDVEKRSAIIIAHRREGKSIRQIARDMSLSRKTVRKYLREFASVFDNEEPDSEQMDDYLCQRPHYDASKRARRVFTDEIKSLIDTFMEKNRQNRQRGMTKQLMLKADMWRRLVDKGHNIAYSTVCQYVRALERNADKYVDVKSYIRQEYEPGVRCEFDWGHLWLDIGSKNKKRKYHIAVFTMNHSNMRMAYLFSHEDSLALMEAHRNFFRYVGGAPQIMAYDNMRTVVKKFLGREREHTDVLQRMETHYCFRPHFCNSRSGWEKGKVEKSVETIRRRAFSFDTEFETLEDAQAHLCNVCERLNGEASNMSAQEKQQRVKADLAALRPLDHGDMGCFEQRSVSVGKYSVVTVCNSHYSVPDYLVGRRLAVKLYSERIVVLNGRDKVATHCRSYCPGSWNIDLMHYLTTFMRKPAALGRSVALTQVPSQVQSLFKKHFVDCERDFIHLLVFTRDNNLSYTDIISAADSLSARGLSRLSAEQIQAQMISSGASTIAPIADDATKSMINTIVDRHQQSIIEQSAQSTLDSLSKMFEPSADVPFVNISTSENYNFNNQPL